MVRADIDDVAGPAERRDQDQRAAEQRVAVAPVQRLRIEDHGEARETEDNPDRAPPRDVFRQEHRGADRNP